MERLLGGTARVPGVSRVERSLEVGSAIQALISCRHDAPAAYQTCLTELIRTGRGLRIRAITGTDVFNAHRPCAASFGARAKNPDDLGVTKVLLVYPFGTAARVRLALEGQDLDTSQFGIDARSTWEFLGIKRDVWRLEPKWVDVLPPTFLAWSEELALVEPYDFGGAEKLESGCIGRRAPILVVRGGTPYHELLRAGFDRVFHAEQGAFRTFSLVDLRPIYSMPNVPRDDSAD